MCPEVKWVNHPGKKLLIDPNSNIEGAVNDFSFCPLIKEKKQCCYVELLVGKSRKIKGNISHIQPFGLAQGNERVESIIVV